MDVDEFDIVNNLHQSVHSVSPLIVSSEAKGSNWLLF